MLGKKFAFVPHRFYVMGVCFSPAPSPQSPAPFLFQLTTDNLVAGSRLFSKVLSLEGKPKLETKRPSTQADGPKSARLKSSTQCSISTVGSLLASNRGNFSDGNRTVAQASRHLHRLPAQALELVLSIYLVHFPVADQNVLGAA